MFKQLIKALLFVTIYFTLLSGIEAAAINNPNVKVAKRGFGSISSFGMGRGGKHH